MNSDCSTSLIVRNIVLATRQVTIALGNGSGCSRIQVGQWKFKTLVVLVQFAMKKQLKKLRRRLLLLSIRLYPSESEAKCWKSKKSSLYLFLKKYLHLKAYKIQLVRILKDTDYANRLNFAKKMLQRLNNFNNILFSDEANFHLNCHVNTQNCRYWAVENPRRKHERPLHSPKFVVWAAMSAKGIIGLYFTRRSTRPSN